MRCKKRYIFVLTKNEEDVDSILKQKFKHFIKIIKRKDGWIIVRIDLLYYALLRNFFDSSCLFKSVTTSGTIKKLNERIIRLGYLLQ